jgi:endonuclease/exonuclease/phosphatase family metal-dependent hydrolase
MNRFKHFSALLLVMACSVAARAAAAAELAETAAAPLRVMTFNIRFDNPRDGANAWPLRKDKVASMVRLYAADIVGMQEALRNQIDELAKSLTTHNWVGVGRNDGKDAGEFTPIFYRRDRLELLDKNTFWLSDTPDKVGSRAWDAALPRIVTWTKFKDKRTEREFFVFNTHFDHQGRVARLNSAKLLRAKAAEIAGDLPALAIGDFNCTPDSAPYKWMIGAPTESVSPESGGAKSPVEVKAPAEIKPADANAPPALVDAASISKHPLHGPTTTWNGFQQLAPGRKLDHIFLRGPIVVEQHAVLADHWDGLWPSDHLPVLAEISLNTPER